jgi:hypothetical protein
VSAGETLTVGRSRSTSRPAPAVPSAKTTSDFHGPQCPLARRPAAGPSRRSLPIAGTVPRHARPFTVGRTHSLGRRRRTTLRQTSRSGAVDSVTRGGRSRWAGEGGRHCVKHRGQVPLTPSPVEVALAGQARGRPDCIGLRHELTTRLPASGRETGDIGAATVLRTSR